MGIFSAGQMIGSGRYRILHELGSGAFADVYLVEQIYLQSYHAAKVLTGRFTPKELQDFQTEAKNAKSLKHIHIIEVHDFLVEKTTSGDIPIMVMQYAPNGSLRDVLSQQRVLTPSQVAYYLDQIAAGLQSVHHKKLIHRDVKPENMLLDNNGNILIADFGIATISHSTLTMQKVDIIGTVAYMSPEQISGKPRPATDQYACAVMVYELLTGELPFDGGGNTMAILGQHINLPFPHLQHVPNSTHQVLQAIDMVLQKATAKDPKDRFKSMMEFAKAFSDAIAGKATVIIQQPVQQVQPPLIRQKPTTPPSFPGNVKKPSNNTVVLVYVDSDEKYAKEFTTYLRAYRITVEDIKEGVAGTSWAMRIQKQVSKSAFPIFLLSSDFMASAPDQDESKVALLSLTPQQAQDGIAIFIRPIDVANAKTIMLLPDFLNGVSPEFYVPSEKRSISKSRDKDTDWSNFAVYVKQKLETI